jgi:hypothetical protein
MSYPVRTTAVFGFIAGLLVIAIYGFLGGFMAISTVLCVGLVVYSALLARWSNTRLVSILYPVLLMLIAAFFSGVHPEFFILLLAVFSWIRSGLCFKNNGLRGMSAEILTAGGGAVMMFFLNPVSAVTCALSIWLFFLIQSLFFFIIPPFRKSSAPEGGHDLFETARKEAENILESIL